MIVTGSRPLGRGEICGRLLGWVRAGFDERVAGLRADARKQQREVESFDRAVQIAAQVPDAELAEVELRPVLDLRALDL
jgi:hypothetical protein